jgi:alpha-ketoglutarate-dependent taurine dioxygenase
LRLLNHVVTTMSAVFNTPVDKEHALRRAGNAAESFGLIGTATGGRPPEWNEALHRQLLDHGYLIFRGVDLKSSNELLEFGKCAGEPLTYAFGQVFELKAQASPDGKTQLSDRAMSIHQDSVLPEAFADIVMMYVWSSPTRGGESLLCDNRRFLELMQERDPELHDFFVQARALYQNHTGNYYNDKGVELANWINKPTLRKHPILHTAMPYFALDPFDDPHCNFTARFDQLSAADSEDRMRRIDAIMRDPEVMHEHALQVGDLIIFDNLLVSHGRNGFVDGTQMRHVSRVQISLGLS